MITYLCNKKFHSDEKLSYLFVIGSKVDYHESLLASGFQLVNPNIKRSCSCGSSFSV